MNLKQQIDEPRMELIKKFKLCIKKLIQEKEKKHVGRGRDPQLVFLVDMEEYDDNMFIDSTTYTLTPEIIYG